MSPNYPSTYPNDAEETWLITAPTGSIINLQFNSFHVRFIVEFKSLAKPNVFSVPTLLLVIREKSLPTVIPHLMRFLRVQILGTRFFESVQKNLHRAVLYISTEGPLIVRKMGQGETQHYANPHYVRHIL